MKSTAIISSIRASRVTRGATRAVLIMVALVIAVGVVLMHAVPASAMQHSAGTTAMQHPMGDAMAQPATHDAEHEKSPVAVSSAATGLDCMIDCAGSAMSSMGCALAPAPTHALPAPAEIVLPRSLLGAHRSSTSLTAIHDAPARAPDLELLSISRI